MESSKQEFTFDVYAASHNSASVSGNIAVNHSLFRYDSDFAVYCIRLLFFNFGILVMYTLYCLGPI